MFDVVNLSFSTLRQCSSIIATATLSNEEDREDATQLAMGKTGDGGYIPTGLNVCPRVLLIVIAKAILIGNRLLQSLKGLHPLFSGRTSSPTHYRDSALLVYEQM
jgi:hypothetical protein